MIRNVCFLLGYLRLLLCMHAQLCPTLWGPMDSYVYVIFQARELECVAISSSSESSIYQNRSQLSWITGKFLYCWAFRFGHMGVVAQMKKILAFILNIFSHIASGSFANHWFYSRRICNHLFPAVYPLFLFFMTWKEVVPTMKSWFLDSLRWKF